MNMVPHSFAMLKIKEAVSAKTLVPVYHIMLCHILEALFESQCNGYYLCFRFRSYTN